MIEISKEAKIKYVQRRIENFDTLTGALQSQSTEPFKMIGHQLKGNARTFGFSELESLAIELEQIGESQDWSKAKSLLTTFKKWIDSQSTSDT